MSEEQHEGKSASRSNRKLDKAELWTCDYKKAFTGAGGTSPAEVLTASQIQRKSLNEIRKLNKGASFTQ